jgi:hypothetical protein
MVQQPELDPIPAPEPVAEPAPVAVSTVVEGEPDEESRSRGRVVRLGLGAAVALVLLVVLVVMVVDGTRSGVGEGGDTPGPSNGTSTSTRAPATTGSSEPVLFTPVVLPSGMVVGRNWRLAGDNGDTFIAAIEVYNGTAEEQSDHVVEVIPKSLAESVDDVKFFGAEPEVIIPDPIVRFAVTVAPGKVKRIGYRISVPGDGADNSRVFWWKAARDADQAALDAQLSTPIPTQRGFRVVPQNPNR